VFLLLTSKHNSYAVSKEIFHGQAFLTKAPNPRSTNRNFIQIQKLLAFFVSHSSFKIRFMAPQGSGVNLKISA
jgi:hypothetical protein